MKQILLVLFLCATISFAQSYVPGHLTVILKDEALVGMTLASDLSATLPNAGSLNALNSAQGLIAMRPLSTKAGSPFRFFFDFEFSSTANMDAMKSTYESNSLVWWASKIPNGSLEHLGSIGAASSFSNANSSPPCGPVYPNDPAFPREWHLDQPNDVDMNLPEAWEWTTGNPNVVIAICGGGVATDTSRNGYVYVRADLARNIWTNPNEIPEDTLDNDNNGFVNDLHGWDVYYDQNDVEARIPGCTGRGDTCFFYVGHGTFGAAWASSQIDNTPLDPDTSIYTRNGWVGVAPNCRIMGLSYPRGNHDRPGYERYGPWSVIYAYENGAVALAFLWGLSGNALGPFVDSAYAHGMLVTNGFGNTLTTVYDLAPPAINCQLVQEDGTLYPTNPVDSRLEIFTPGNFGSGQSACAVASVIALMKSVNPYLAAPQLRSILLDTGSTTPVPASPVPVRRSDALKAIRNASGAPLFYDLGGQLEPDERDGLIHPVLYWTANPLISSFVPTPTIDMYIVQKKRPSDTCFHDLDSVSGTTTSYTDMTEYIPGEMATPTAVAYRVRARLDYGSTTLLSVSSNVQGIGTYPIDSKANAGFTPNLMPLKTQLFSNYPNPFNPTTTIRFDLAAPGNIIIRLFDILGQEVATLVNETLEAGSHERTFDASKLSSGVYFYRLQTGGFSETKKLILSK